jgi:hypothetical protein
VKKIIFFSGLCFFLALSEQASAQRRRTKAHDAYASDSNAYIQPKALVGAQLFGDLGFGGVNAQQYLTSNKLVNISVREGLGFIPGSHEEPPPYIESVLLTAAGLNLIAGKKFAVEAGISPGLWVSKPTYFMTNFSLALRLQDIGGNDNYFCAGFNTFLYPYRHREISFFPFSVGFGKTF